MRQISLYEWLRVARRGGLLIVLIGFCFVLLLLLRLFEKPMFGVVRPVTPRITQFVCRSSLHILGLGFRENGTARHDSAALLSNHISWMDILSLNAGNQIYFVSKREVSKWFGIGWLARATGTIFIERHPQKSLEHAKVLEARLRAGHTLLFFPEGTSTDGLRILPFKTTLFEPFFSSDLRTDIHIQPVTLFYHAPAGASLDFYGWWGTAGFGGHLLKILAVHPQGSVDVTYLKPVRVSDFADRKVLARHLEDEIRGEHQRYVNTLHMNYTPK
ncbi:MAG: lysophospholipid acyltransferase family protein [Aestuariivita sp.]|nr:lysophospholipid acyltransferase family protein [Aestuariivita sp.]